MTRPWSHTYLHTVSAVLPDGDAGDSMEQLILPLAMDGAVGHSAVDRKRKRRRQRIERVAGSGLLPEQAGGGCDHWTCPSGRLRQVECWDPRRIRPDWHWKRQRELRRWPAVQLTSSDGASVRGGHRFTVSDQRKRVTIKFRRHRRPTQ